jgi:acetyltransferase-like isoleucine patch superfamily enzyme
VESAEPGRSCGLTASVPISSEGSQLLSDLHPDRGATIFWRKLLFRLRERIGTVVVRPIRVSWWTMQGMKIGKRTSFSSLQVSWPHQVRIGEDCRIEHQVYFHFDGIYKPGPSILIGDGCFVGYGCEFNITNRIEIGDHCLIASGCTFVDHNHGTAAGDLIGSQPCPSSPILLERDVWVGANSVILAGVTIGQGAVIGAGSVVTRAIPANAIVAGVPAEIIRFRDQTTRE